MAFDIDNPQCTSTWETGRRGDGETGLALARLRRRAQSSTWEVEPWKLAWSCMFELIQMPAGKIRPEHYRWHAVSILTGRVPIRMRALAHGRWFAPESPRKSAITKSKSSAPWYSRSRAITCACGRSCSWLPQVRMSIGIALHVAIQRGRRRMVPRWATHPTVCEWWLAGERGIDIAPCTGAGRVRKARLTTRRTKKISPVLLGGGTNENTSTRPLT